MTNRVLVLCQRKSGIHGVRDVSDTVVPMINEYVESHFGDDSVIEYLSDVPPIDDDGVDYRFSLNRRAGNHAAATFIEDHTQYYSLIILNTCPIMLMDFTIIHQLLASNGLMYISGFPKQSDFVIANRVYNGEEKMASVRHLFDTIGLNLYKKIDDGAGNQSPYKKQKPRKKQKTHKPYKKQKPRKKQKTHKPYKKQKPGKKQNPYIAAPITPLILLPFSAKAIKIGLLTMPKIIPKPCTILFTISFLICVFEFLFCIKVSCKSFLLTTIFVKLLKSIFRNLKKNYSLFG